MKNISFFPEASQSGQWWTFVAWTVAGMLMLVAGAVLQQRREKAVLTMDVLLHQQ
ncbi:hypothetical protein [Bifidobacterium psychraerophilum]|uniref:hypothetical protein n=1 Tax=Bifidobacterium psychraerophilum TaxID=218140 RepID=UPI0039EBBA4C